MLATAPTGRDDDEESSRIWAAGCFPDATQTLLLTAALAPPEIGARAWSQWRTRTDLDAADYGSVFLFPLLHINLADTGALGLDEPRLRGFRRYNWVRSQRRNRVVGSAIARLADEGIETLGLKGIVLGPRYYPHAAARPMADADILTRREDAERAVAVLERTGWSLMHPPFAREVRRGASTPLRNTESEELDLHWHVLSVLPFADTDTAFWQRAVPVRIDGVPSRALRPTDELLHLIVHGLHWNPVHSLRWVADAVMVLRATPAFDWEELCRTAGHLELVSPVRSALTYLARRSFATVPDHVLTVLEGLPASPGHRLEWWARMRGPALPPGPPGYVIRHWRQYQRLQRHAGRWPTPGGFLRFVADGLRVDGPVALAADVWRQTLERVRWAAR